MKNVGSIKKFKDEDEFEDEFEDVIDDLELDEAS